jgi:hypothetical protein
MFVVVTAAMMIFLVPMLLEQAHAFTEAFVSFNGLGPGFANVRGHLEAGEWVKKPQLFGNGQTILWSTRGEFPLNGDEKGRVDADVVGVGHVTFFWSNPDSGRNTCDARATGLLHVSCSIPPRGHLVDAIYRVSILG